MEHEVVAVGIREERHVADARVERLAVELHALRLERRARLRDVVAPQRPRVALLRDERHALLLGLPDAEARVAGPLLPFGVFVGSHAQDVAIERAGALGVLRRHAEEVESFDDSHRATVPQIAVRSGPRSAPPVAATGNPPASARISSCWST